eukprot:6933888-Alexandrium_andersonii.AAC.1
MRARRDCLGEPVLDSAGGAAPDAASEVDSTAVVGLLAPPVRTPRGAADAVAVGYVQRVLLRGLVHEHRKRALGLPDCPLPDLPGRGAGCVEDYCGARG